MRVIKVELTNFRNYENLSVELSGRRNILIGQNAHGKTNFLESIEILATGRSGRSQHEFDLIRKGQNDMRIAADFESRGRVESASFSLSPSQKQTVRGIQKRITVNGLTFSSTKNLRGRLVTVGFKSADLNLLRGGPKYRRDWIDEIITTLKPIFHEVLAKYQKTLSQRNRLLKTLFEKGSTTAFDYDQLQVWDEQIARFGSQIIKQRVRLLYELLPMAEQHQSYISGRHEFLTAEYLLRGPEENADADIAQNPTKIADLITQTDGEIAEALMKLLRLRRREEIARKQTLSGPHRDDIRFSLNDSDAVEFASQGQQRSLVLSFKLAELERVQVELDEPPILLLDDVLAELDLNRQGLLMSLVKNEMQTIITTTHVSGFKPEWLDGALVLEVQDGTIVQSKEPLSIT